MLTPYSSAADRPNRRGSRMRCSLISGTVPPMHSAGGKTTATDRANLIATANGPDAAMAWKISGYTHRYSGGSRKAPIAVTAMPSSSMA